MILAQFREIGMPRCSRYGDEGCGRRLIWPWQDWICGVEDWPEHHDCYHRHLDRMRAWLIDDELAHGYEKHSDMYDECRFCERRTAR